MSSDNMDNYFWQGKRVRLRPKAEDDWRLDLHEWTDTKSMRMLDATVHPPTSEEQEQERNRERMNRPPEQGIVLSIGTLEGQLVGSIALNSIHQQDGRFHFSMRIGREFRRRGYGEEALRMILRCAFHELRLQKCEVTCIEPNAAAIALYKKVGFQEEGRQRRHFYTDGRFYDGIPMGLLREDFDENEGRTTPST